MEMNDRRKEDAALRESLSRINEQIKQEPMPDDFEQRVMSRMNETHNFRRRMKVAAMFIGVLLVSGIAWAAWQLSDHHDQKEPSVDVQAISLQPVEAQNDIVRFDNVRLDSVLTVVADHYGKTVHFRNESVRQLRFLIEWKREASLSQFMKLINNFEGIQVSEANDTIFAE